MHKWEYKFIEVKWSRAHRVNDVAELERLGQEGWEAISVKDEGTYTTFIILLKRPLPESPNN
jgi:hypothetical protein